MVHLGNTKWREENEIPFRSSLLLELLGHVQDTTWGYWEANSPKVGLLSASLLMLKNRIIVIFSPDLLPDILYNQLISTSPHLSFSCLEWETAILNSF